MKVTAVISEYNPFHNGHKYQLDKIRESGSTHIVAVMSSNFVQRGDLAVFDKRTRAKAALECGADLVVELPTPYALASARQFSFGAVSIINALGCVDEMNFGSECGDIKKLTEIAKFVYSEDIYSALEKHLEKGMTFPSARSLAVKEKLGEEAEKIISEPNNTLGIEYIGQLLQTKSSVLPTTVTRTVSHHADGGKQSFASASYIRKLILNDDFEDTAEFVPHTSFKIYEEAIKSRYAPNSIVKLYPQLLYKLRCMDAEDFAKLPDISEGLENRIYSVVRKYNCITKIIEEIKTKRYTHSRIRRILVAALLSIDGDMCIKPPPYIRIIGFNERGREILAVARKTATLPISDSLARLEKFGGECERYAKLEALASDIYTLSMEKIKPCGEEYRENVVKKNDSNNEN